jgi:hypothetical protein
MELAGAADAGDQSGAPVCVTGMHRTGTSLVAALLQRHGLWLGDEAEMMPANPYNPDGYFENDRLVELNDAILSLFGGSWSSPPRFPESWTDDPRLDEAKETARAIGASLAANHQAWGFKDPRASLTLPFWRAVWGDVFVVVTLRNPIETARSLHRRDGMSLEEGIALWSAHYRAILDQTTPATRTVVGYEAFCIDPMGSAGALLSRLPALGEVDADAVRATVRSPLRHYRATPAEVQKSGVSGDVLELHEQLRDETVNSESQGPESQADDVAAATISGLDLAIRDVHVEVQRLAAVVDRLEIEIGFARTADLAGIRAQLEYQRELVERIAQVLPSPGEPAPATEAAVGLSVNGSQD